jgi:hypothetical protein
MRSDNAWNPNSLLLYPQGGRAPALVLIMAEASFMLHQSRSVITVTNTSLFEFTDALAPLFL